MTFEVVGESFLLCVLNLSYWLVIVTDCDSLMPTLLCRIIAAVSTLQFLSQNFMYLPAEVPNTPSVLLSPPCT